MKIGALAQASGVNARLIRHYESIGLISKASRTASDYRIYSATDIQFLKFIKRARGLGFSIKEIKKLIGLWKNKSRASRAVKDLAIAHILALQHKMREMQDMTRALQILSRQCKGDNRPECPIIGDLENA